MSGAPAPELGENDYNNYEFAPSRMLILDGEPAAFVFW